MVRTRVKFCGLTRAQDAHHAARVGVDAVGVVFYAPSPRAVTLTQAREVLDALPAFVTRVGLFVNPTPDEVWAVLNEVSLDVLQFHGEESPSLCRAFARPYIKALRMRPQINVHAAATEYGDARALLLDSYVAGSAGGTGTCFDWSWVPSDLPLPLILAGGLVADNVAQAMRTVRPYALDVSGGIETTTKGIKDEAKMAAFMHEVYHADVIS